MIQAIFSSQSASWNLVERMVFPAPAPSYELQSFPGELILIPREGGVNVPCLFLKFQHARFLMMFFHANAEDLGLVYNFCCILRDLFQVNVLAVEYPGYGICPGTSTEEGIVANAEAAMQFATDTLGVPHSDILLFGRSLGTGPTIALATRYQTAGVILVSPFTSIKELFQRRVGWLADYLEDRFANLALAPKISSPTLIIHGLQDSLVPPEHGREIYASISTKRMLVTPVSMTHNSSLLRDVASFVMPMTSFFSLPDYAFENVQVPDWAYPAPPAKPAASMDSNERIGFCNRCYKRGGDEAVVEPISRLRSCPEEPVSLESAGVRFESMSDDSASMGFGNPPSDLRDEASGAAGLVIGTAGVA